MRPLAPDPDPRKRVLMFLCGKSSPWMETGFLCSTKKKHESLAHMFHDERQHPRHTWAAASMTTKGTLSKSQCESTASPRKRNGGQSNTFWCEHSQQVYVSLMKRAFVCYQSLQRNTVTNICILRRCVFHEKKGSVPLRPSTKKLS